jgi:hypothetical protein
MNPHSSANTSTVSCGSVQNADVDVLRPCRCRPVFSGE